jgi:hypothetical protein
MKINNKFNLEDIVFLITDDEQKTRIVSGILIRPNGILYSLQYCTTESWHYDFEIEREKNYLI